MSMPVKFLFEILSNQQWVPVVVERRGRHVVVELPGRRVTVDVEGLSEAAYSLVIDGQSYDVTVGVAEKAYQVSVNGSQFDVCLRNPRKFRKPTASGSDSAGPLPVAAPMPGKIVKLLVREGEAVNEGQGVIVIEAMKMQNELKAPRTGTVETIRVTENQAVNAGESLLVVR
jgi:biotin carboxyl carrier protein